MLINTECKKRSNAAAVPRDTQCACVTSELRVHLKANCIMCYRLSDVVALSIIIDFYGLHHTRAPVGHSHVMQYCALYGYYSGG